MDMLILCDADGYVDMTPSAIAGRTRWPIDDVNNHLKALSEPDLMSRTPDHDGRRIELLDAHRPWGWRIINYDSFRKIASDEQRKAKQRDRFNRWKASTSGTANASLTASNASNAMQRQRQKQMQKQNNTQPVNGVSSELQEVRAQWIQAYETALGSQYRRKFNKKQFDQDTKSLEILIKSGMNGKQIFTMMTNIFKKLNEMGRNHPSLFYSKNAMTIEGFVNHITHIENEMEQFKKFGPSGGATASHNRSTSNPDVL
jgi:hypothetical protein